MAVKSIYIGLTKIRRGDFYETVKVGAAGSSIFSYIKELAAKIQFHANSSTPEM